MTSVSRGNSARNQSVDRNLLAFQIIFLSMGQQNAKCCAGEDHTKKKKRLILWKCFIIIFFLVLVLILSKCFLTVLFLVLVLRSNCASECARKKELTGQYFRPAFFIWAYLEEWNILVFYTQDLFGDCRQVQRILLSAALCSYCPDVGQGATED